MKPKPDSEARRVAAPPDTSSNWCLIAGDNHSSFKHINEAALRLKPKLVISVGDIQAKRPLEVELAPLLSMGIDFFWCHGNHDTDGESDYRNAFLSGLAKNNLHGRTVQLNRYIFSGLGGVFRESIWMPSSRFVDERDLIAGANFFSYEHYIQHVKRKNHRTWASDPTLVGKIRKHRSSIFPADYLRLLKHKAHVLITHEAGVWAHPYGQRAIDYLRERIGAHLHFSGHHHCFRWRRNDRGESSVVVGLNGIVNIGVEVVREGDLDRQRPDPQYQ